MEETIKMLQERLDMLNQGLVHSLANHNALVGRIEETKFLIEEAKKLKESKEKNDSDV